MKFQKAILFAAIALLGSIAAMPAGAQWSTKQRTDFTNDCLAACRQNPRVPEAQRPQCDTYCLCVVREGQKLFDEQKFEQINKDFLAKNQTADIKTFQGLTPACNREAFSR